VGEWAKGTRTVQNAADEHRLRAADQSPARLLGEGDPEDADSRVLSAARAFVAGG